MFDVAQIKRATLHVIDNTTGRSHDHVRAAFQTGDLWSVGLSAIDRENREVAEVGGVAGERLGYLDCEFAGGSKDERQRGPWAFPPGNATQKRKRESRGFTRSRLSQTNDVATVEQKRNRLGLNGGGGLISQICDCACDTFVEIEVGKTNVSVVGSLFVGVTHGYLFLD